MYHAHFCGDHYEIGARWGSRLAERGNFILDRIPFPISAQRVSFAWECLPLYKTYFPAILEEIRGIAAGQRCQVEPLYAVLFSMYAIPPSCCCSCFAVSNGKTVLLGRNSDFLPALEKLNQNVIYRFSSGAYAFTGNTTAFLEMEDGVNEKGLAAGLTSVYPHTTKPGISAGLLLRLILESCASTGEAIRLVQSAPMGSSHTLTLADSSGEIAVLECNADNIEILRPSAYRPYVCATNLFHSAAMASFQQPGVDAWQAEERRQTLERVLQAEALGMEAPGGMELLAGKKGFLCQYDRATGKDTVWSVLYDLKNRRVFRAEGNPSRKKFRLDSRFGF